MRESKYILDENGEPVPCADVLEWGRWMEGSGHRVVSQEHVGPYFISTVFLGLDHSFSDTEDPVLWETMVFRKGEEVESHRYTSHFSACRGHNKMVEKYGKQGG